MTMMTSLNNKIHLNIFNYDLSHKIMQNDKKL